MNAINAQTTITYLEEFIQRNSEIFHEYGFNINKEVQYNESSPGFVWVEICRRKIKCIDDSKTIPIELWCDIASKDRTPRFSFAFDVSDIHKAKIVQNIPNLALFYDPKKWDENWATQSADVDAKYYRQIIFEDNSLKDVSTYDECYELDESEKKIISVLLQDDDERASFYSYFFDESEVEEAIEEFLVEILNNLKDGSISDTERIAVTQARRGQGLYRRRLMEYWGNACSITGCKIPQVLRASHAKPWASCTTASDRLSQFNGFLLTANLDALFDKGLITFDDSGKICIAEQINSEQQKALGINSDMCIRVGMLSEKHLEYLHYHQKYVWQDHDRGEHVLVKGDSE